MDGDSRGGDIVEKLLKASEYFLDNRNIAGCRKYAFRAQENDPLNAAAAQLLAVADVIAASETRVGNDNDNQPDWYAILQVSRYSQDTNLFNTQFKTLISLLNPNKSKFSLAKEAYDLVREAWGLLVSSPKKAQFDRELRIFESESEFKRRIEEEMAGKCGSRDEAFWTVCPYCCFVYEYPRVYKECCLRCQNEKCRKGFHAVVIPNPPPPEVVEKGQYWFFGSFGPGFDAGEGKGFSSWTPFSPVDAREKNKTDVPVDSNVCDMDDLIEISDSSDDSSDEFESKDCGKPMNGDMENGKTVEMQNGDGKEVPNVKKPAMKRRKSVARTTKKLMGKGTRINLQETRAPPQSNEGGSGGDFVNGGVEFFDGDDDIFVGLEDGI